MPEACRQVADDLPGNLGGLEFSCLDDEIGVIADSGQPEFGGMPGIHCARAGGLVAAAGAGEGGAGGHVQVDDDAGEWGDGLAEGGGCGQVAQAVQDERLPWCPPGVIKDQAGEGAQPTPVSSTPSCWRMLRLAGRPRAVAMARIVSPYPSCGQPSRWARRVAVVVLPDPIGPAMARTAGFMLVIAASPGGWAG